MDDHDIIELYNARSEDAIEETNKKYGRYCRAIAFRILYNEEDSEECINDVWLQTWTLIPPKIPPCLRTFLGRITRNLAFHLAEKQTAAKRGGGELPLVLDELSECIPAPQTTEDLAETRVLTQVITAFVQCLPDDERYIFLHRCWYVESVSEIAKELGISENYTKVILHRTRKKLKQTLEKEGIDL